MASKRNIRRRSCIGKARHDTAQEAGASIKYTHSKHGHSDMNVYKCKWCGKYHIGHATRKSIRQRRIAQECN